MRSIFGADLPSTRSQTAAGGANFPQAGATLRHAARKACSADFPNPTQRRQSSMPRPKACSQVQQRKRNRSKISLTPDGEGTVKIELLKLQTQIETPQKPAFRPAALSRRSWPQARNCAGAALLTSSISILREGSRPLGGGTKTGFQRSRSGLERRHSSVSAL